MACVGKKVAKYTSGPLMVNNCAFSAKTQAVQHQLAAGRSHHPSHLVPVSLVGSASVQKRHRTTFSPKQLKVLEEAFEQNNYPCPAFREQIANRANLDLSRVQVWFQNRRAKHKKQVSQAMRCFAAAAAASSTAYYQAPQPTSFTYQTAEPHHPQQQQQQQQQQHLQPLDHLQVASPYGQNENLQQQDQCELNSLSLEQNFYQHRSANSLSQSLIEPDDNQMTEQHLQQIKIQNDPQLQHQHQQQDPAQQFEVAEFCHILNNQLGVGASISSYSGSPVAQLKLNPPHSNLVAFDSALGTVGEPRPRQQVHESVRDGLEYLY